MQIRRHCNVFTSRDKLHKSCAALFLRPEQRFLWGPDLKSDLSAIDDHFDKLPQAVKERGVLSFAAVPPQDHGFLVSRLWDEYRPGWRCRSAAEPEKDEEPQGDRGLLDELNRFVNSPPLSASEVDFNVDSPQNVGIERKVLRKKGKWRLVPKENG